MFAMNHIQIERHRVVYTSLVFLLLGGAASQRNGGRRPQRHNGSPSGASVCRTQPCQETAKKYLEMINPSANPCNDFYEYACGKWITATEIPDNETSVSPFDELDKKNKLIAQDILSRTPDGMFSAEMKAKLIYTQCKNEEETENLRAKPVLDMLAEYMGGWPLLEKDRWDSSNFDLFDILNKLAFIGIQPFFQLTVFNDVQNPLQNLIYLYSPTTFATVDFLMDETMGSVYNQSYKDFLTKVTSLLLADIGSPDDAVASDLDDIFQTEAFIGMAKFTAVEQKSDKKFLNKITLSELSTNPFRSAVLTNITGYIKTIFQAAGQGVFEDSIVVVPDLQFWDKLDAKLLELEELGEEGKRRMANYIGWQMIKGYAAYLSYDYRRADAEYSQKVTGTAEIYMASVGERCLQIITGFMPLALGAVYVRDVVPPDLKEKATMMIDDIRQGFLELLNQADWMDQATRERADQKLSTIIDMVAYPDIFVSNISAVNDEYEDISLGATFVESVNQLMNYTFTGDLKRLGDPNIRGDPVVNTGDITVVDASYNPIANLMRIPVGILQLPFFNAGSPQYLNYGGIGFVIGHETTHGFDDMGSLYDDQGFRKSWWTNETYDTYQKRVDGIINQYNAYITPYGKINGKLTSGENVADNGGLRAAYKGYKRYRERIGQPEPVLPGLEKFTPEQLFFISSANIWCYKGRPEVARSELLTEVHSPKKFRVNGVVSNMPEFAQAFNCPKNSKMNPNRKYVVW
ncbi:neprilysin-11-like [Paramacrobiotus metropolitanus]|uniref:neprilysin-11-like n=1 Tax=Paramacrobiotus metropolitanus TaxID=2943436 RepID=UPI0024460B32|nr:neprilysin-11-like [Paramacrobiotus metropolitanus]